MCNQNQWPVRSLPFSLALGVAHVEPAVEAERDPLPQVEIVVTLRTPSPLTGQASPGNFVIEGAHKLMKTRKEIRLALLAQSPVIRAVRRQTRVTKRWERRR